MTFNLPSNSRSRGVSVCGLGGLALASVLLLCGAGNLPVENFTPQGPMQADLNAGGHSLTNAATISATNVAATSLTVATATAGSVNATNVAVSGSLTAPNFTLPFASITNAPTTLAGYGITNAYTEPASDARYAPLAGSTNVTTLGAVTAGSFPYANLTDNPVTVTAGKTLAVANTLTLAGTDGSTLNVGAGGTLGSAAFAATSAFLAPSAIGTTVQAYNASTTTLGNAVNGANDLAQTDTNGWLVDAVQRPGAKMLYVSQSKGTDTRTGLSKYSLHTPFATLTAAASAAAAGDTIVAEDGVFTDKNLVLATGVDWFFMPAASVVVTGAVNGDVIFKDNGTAATVVLAGCGQTFSISSTAVGATVSTIAITAASNLTTQGLSFASSGTGNSATIATLESNNASAVITITGNLTSTATGGATSAGVNIDSSGGGTIAVNGNVIATGALSNGTAIYCVSTTTSSGNVTVTGRVSSNSIAIYGSTTCTLTCGSLSDGVQGSQIYNHLTLLGVGLVSMATTPISGFSANDTLGPNDNLFEITPTGTIASGTFSLPPDMDSRLGERVTVLATQTITTLTVNVPSSGTLYGYTPMSVGPGSITFEKIGSNTWVKL
jgi:hypothetical protein